MHHFILIKLIKLYAVKLLYFQAQNSSYNKDHHLAEFNQRILFKVILLTSYQQNLLADQYLTFLRAQVNSDFYLTHTNCQKISNLAKETGFKINFFLGQDFKSVYQHFVVKYAEQRSYFENIFQQILNCLHCVHLRIVAIQLSESQMIEVFGCCYIQLCWVLIQADQTPLLQLINLIPFFLRLSVLALEPH